MTKRSPDYQKQKAKQDLWDNDGEHTSKKARNRGKARNKDKKLIRNELTEHGSSIRN